MNLERVASRVRTSAMRTHELARLDIRLDGLNIIFIGRMSEGDVIPECVVSRENTMAMWASVLMDSG